MGVKITKALRDEASEYHALVERARRLGVETAVSFADEGETVVELRKRVAHAQAELCEGHPAGPFSPMGETVYCDGTCQPASGGSRPLIHDGPDDNWGGW